MRCKFAFFVGIKIPASTRILRHIIATYLIESGINIRYIQMLLGHNSMKRQKYIHM